MNKSKSILRITYIVAVAAVVLLFFVVSGNLGAPAKSLTGTGDPQETVSAFFDALHKADYETVNGILGNCTLVNTDMSQQSEVNRKLFSALSDSISSRFAGDCRVDGLNAVQTVQVTYFDISSSAAQLNTLTKEQLDLMLSEVDNASELYDENGEYRHDVVMQVFEQAVVIMLENVNDYYVTREFDINLFYEDDNWYIEPSEDILGCMIGGMK